MTNIIFSLEVYSESFHFSQWLQSLRIGVCTVKLRTRLVDSWKSKQSLNIAATELGDLLKFLLGLKLETFESLLGRVDYGQSVNISWSWCAKLHILALLPNAFNTGFFSQENEPMLGRV
jgi:hypothetical protein